MNRGYFKKPLLRRLYELWIPDEVMNYMRAMRKYAYYSQKTVHHRFKNPLFYIKQMYYKRRFTILGYKLGYSIGANSYGYGLVFHHHGSIICGPSNKIGNYALMNTSTCIVDRGSIIGDGFFMGSGAVVTKQLSIGDNVWVGANSVVNKDFPDGCAMIAGIPVEKIKKTEGAWYQSLYRDFWKWRHDEVEKLKVQYGL